MKATSPGDNELNELLVMSNGRDLHPVYDKHVNGLVQERRNSSANALELRLACRQ